MPQLAGEYRASGDPSAANRIEMRSACGNESMALKGERSASERSRPGMRLRKLSSPSGAPDFEPYPHPLPGLSEAAFRLRPM
jgi:hypothetical protein